MRRRDFIELIAGSAIVWPLAVRAQKPAILHGGVAMGSTENDREHQLLIECFRAKSTDTGMGDGSNVEITNRFCGGRRCALSQNEF
jgi:hypothetical protein